MCIKQELAFSYNKGVYQIMCGMNNNINNGIGGAFVFLVIFKCLPFFIYQHIEMLVLQVKEFLLLKPLVIVCIPSLCGVLMSDVLETMSWY